MIRSISYLSLSINQKQLEVLLASNALGLGRSWWTIASQIATLASFYLTSWEEYYTGMFPVNLKYFIFSYCSCVRPAVSRILLRAGWRDYHDCHYIHHHWLLRFATSLIFSWSYLQPTLYFNYRSFVLGPRLMENHASRSYTFLPDLRLNESFMVLAGALLAFNIIHRFFYFFQALHIVLNTKKNLLIPKQLS